MTPVARIAWGFLIVLVDLRIQGLDVVPDIVGWILAVSGTGRLFERSGWFRLATAACAVGIATAVPGAVSEPGTVLALAEGLAMTGLVFGACSGIRAVVAEPSVRRTADWIRWLDLGLMVVAGVLGALGESLRLPVSDASPPVGLALAALVVPLVVVALAVAVWFVVFLLRLRHHPTLQAPAHAVG